MKITDAFNWKHNKMLDPRSYFSREDMLVVRFEDLLQEPEATLRRICEHVEQEFHRDMLPAPHHTIPFGSRFRDRWYPLSPERALHYINQATPEDLQIVEKHCGELAKNFGYDNCA